MAHDNSERRPKGRPGKGINPKTGKPYESVKRKEFDALLRRAAKPKG